MVLGVISEAVGCEYIAGTIACTLLPYVTANSLSTFNHSQSVLWPQAHAWLTDGTDRSAGEITPPGRACNQ